MEGIDKNLVAIIMAGGVGTRFWPLSTHERPKQFIQLFDDRSLLQKSYDRVAGIVPDERVIVLTNRQFTPLVREQLPNIPDQNIIGEPERKDTAAAVCLGALVAMKRFGNPVIVILTADHLIEPVEKFQQTLVSAVKEARGTGALYTFGIKPTHPATGYGYLEVGEKTAMDQDVEHFQVVSFKEKPNAEVAGQYLESGRYLWNSGMFVWTVDAIFGELALHLPKHVAHLTKAVEKMGTDQWEDELQERFASLARISIDYAVMEKAPRVLMVELGCEWLDVGSWPALEHVAELDEAGNAVVAENSILVDSFRNVVVCQDDHLLAILGMDDCIVVRSADATLVCNKSDSQRLKEFTQLIEKRFSQRYT